MDGVYLIVAIIIKTLSLFWLLLLRFELSYNKDDDDDDDTDGNTVSSSVSGSDRVRWWKQLIWFDFVIWLDDGHIFEFEFEFVLLLMFVADKCEEDDE